MPHTRFHLSRALFLLVVLPAWCMGLLAVRFLRTGATSYFYLAWNLVLAMVPACAALMLVNADRQRATAVERLGWGVLWLLFLPNAPYIVTDLVHFAPRPPVPLWYDTAMVVSFVCTGLLLGYGSVADVQAVVARRFGTAAGWWLAMAAMLLSGLGIYMGRFLRWNSWDAVTRPHELLRRVAGALAEPTEHVPGLRITLLYGIGLALGYAAVHLIVPRHGPQAPAEPRQG